MSEKIKDLIRLKRTQNKIFLWTRQQREDFNNANVANTMKKNPPKQN